MAEGLIGSRFQSDLSQRLKPTWTPLSFPLPVCSSPFHPRTTKFMGGWREDVGFSCHIVLVKDPNADCRWLLEIYECMQITAQAFSRWA